MCKYIQAEGGSQTGELYRGAPITCDFCKTEAPDSFIDGVVEGDTQWAIMCIECFKAHGKRLGPGFGQKYCKKQ